jgi:DNA-binding MarR family transcriptional regulator/N-acetylglutamate synthase-like GNAT family acetyltransferase
MILASSDAAVRAEPVNQEPDPAMSSRTRAATAAADRVAAIRRFNRFYTRLIGVLDEGHLHTPFSLTEVRVLFELAHRDGPTATDIAGALGLDAGYLSRLLQRLQRSKLIVRTPSPHDARHSHIALSAEGRKAFRNLDRLASEDIARLLDTLDGADQRHLLEAMRTIGRLLGDPDVGTSSEPAYILRPPHPGDYGWIVQIHGELYAREYGWQAPFEALVARVVADYVEQFDPAYERCWIAERRGEKIGCVFVQKDRERKGVAKLRMLLVHPSARGLGVGRRLVDEVTRFARDTGYHTLSLWTHVELTTARKIYADAGYTKIREEVHEHFGKPLTSETWEMKL